MNRILEKEAGWRSRYRIFCYTSTTSATISSISAERTCMVRRGSARLGSWSLDDMGYDIVKYDAGDVRNKALIDTLTNNMSNNNVLRLMYKSGKDSDNNGRTGRDKSGGQRVYPRPHKDNPPEEDEEAETGKRLLYSYNLYRELLHGQKMKELINV
jgi:hypothetical protein